MLSVDAGAVVVWAGAWTVEDASVVGTALAVSVVALLVVVSVAAVAVVVAAKIRTDNSNSNFFMTYSFGWLKKRIHRA